MTGWRVRIPITWPDPFLGGGPADDDCGRDNEQDWINEARDMQAFDNAAFIREEVD